MKNNKGITLSSLVIYIALIFVVLGILMRITMYFRNNMVDAADVSFETEFNKLNLYLLDESKKFGNQILKITEGTEISFSEGNKYKYNSSDRTIYLNDTIKICEKVERCLFEQKIAPNGKTVVIVTIQISGTEKTVEYVITADSQEVGQVKIQDYMWGAGLVTYYLKVGDYVDYTPDTGTYKVAAGTTGSGYDSVQSFTTETDNKEAGTSKLKWRVLSIDEETGEIELISATVVNKVLRLIGADGYNHGVDILNDLCETLYSKTENGVKIAIGRSINEEDVNSKTIFDITTHSRFGAQNKPSNQQYPNIYIHEIGSTANGLKETKNLLKKSDRVEKGTINSEGVTEYTKYIGSSTASSLNTTHTYYYYKTEDYLNVNLGINTIPIGLFSNMGGSCWVASRSVGAYGGDTNFGICILQNDSSIGRSDVFTSTGTEYNYPFYIRPVVTLDASQLLDFSVGDGSKDNPWGMK